MKIDERAVMQQAFLKVFPIMVNRVVDMHLDDETTLQAGLDCWSEFHTALEEHGIFLGIVEK